jgi:hypothetical protein
MGQKEFVPFEGCYHIDTQLMAGPYPAAVSFQVADRKLRALLDAGIDYFIDLTEADEGRMFGRPLIPYQSQLEEIAGENGIPFVHRRFPTEDMEVPDERQMITILDDIDAARSSGHHVYVHCLGGVGRTGTVIGCWLARHGVAVGDEALEAIALLRDYQPGRDLHSPQTSQQCDMVRGWTAGR